MPSSEPRLKTLLLAAGSSRRFGADKLVAPLPDGTPMVLATAHVLLAAGADVLAVVREGPGASQSGAASLLGEMAGVEVVVCSEADRGLGHSLACGVRHSAGADGWLVALADMPWVRPQTVTDLLDVLAHGASLTAPRCAGRRGHPVGFAAHWRDALGRLSGDTGARDLLVRHHEQLTLIDVDDQGVLWDLDRPADLAAAPAQLGRMQPPTPRPRNDNGTHKR
jgi:molybdenum cofactor cytidylyltransferase